MMMIIIGVKDPLQWILSIYIMERVCMITTWYMLAVNIIWIGLDLNGIAFGFVVLISPI